VLESLSPQRRRFVLTAIGLCVVAVVVGLFRYSVTRPADVTPVSQHTAGPVLLVPGFGGSTTSLKVLQSALQRVGRDAVIVSLPGDGTGDLRSQARVLDKAAHAALHASRTSSVDVVGYSAGGVVARYWVRRLGGGNLARRIVTLGSPNHGTALAGIATDLTPDTCPVACRQLVPDSDFLSSLNAGDETPPGPEWVSIWTTDDRTVVPADSASIKGALDFSVQSVCAAAHVEHGELPSDPLVIAMTLAELGRTAPKVPSRLEVC
jgi:triacylglycerol lipase